LFLLTLLKRVKQNEGLVYFPHISVKTPHRKQTPSHKLWEGGGVRLRH